MAGLGGPVDGVTHACPIMDLRHLAIMNWLSLGLLKRKDMCVILRIIDYYFEYLMIIILSIYCKKLSKLPDFFYAGFWSYQSKTDLDWNTSTCQMSHDWIYRVIFILSNFKLFR